jgi:hypothetical protein
MATLAEGNASVLMHEKIHPVRAIQFSAVVWLGLPLQGGFIVGHISEGAAFG